MNQALRIKTSELNQAYLYKKNMINKLHTILLTSILSSMQYSANAQLFPNKELMIYSVMKEGRELFGIKNTKDDTVLEANFSFIRWAEDFNYGLVGHPTTIEGTGIIDREGKLILDPLLYKNCDISMYKNDEGLMVVFINGFARTSICLEKHPYTLYGYINTSGKEVIPPQYVNAGPFINGSAEVEDTNGRIFRIDETGKKL